MDSINQLSANKPALERVKPFARKVIRRLPGRRVRWGTLRRTRPFSNHFGWDRGEPVDRGYIEEFLDRNSHLIKGDAMEVRRPEYLSRFGNGEVEAVHVVDIDPDNPQATIIADLGVAHTLPPESFDSIVFTQTLHFIADDQTAISNLWRSLKPGGTLLITVPSTIRRDNELPESDFWRYTPLGLEDVLRRSIGEDIGDAEIHVEGFGNVLTAIAFLAGIAREELSARELKRNDPNFPIVACASVTKKPARSSPAAALLLPAASFFESGFAEAVMLAV